MAQFMLGAVSLLHDAYTKLGGGMHQKQEIWTIILVRVQWKTTSMAKIANI